MDGSGFVIGIDLGTTNSVVAVIEAGEASVIPNLEGQAKTPSVIALMEDGQVIVGEIARRQASTQPERTISSVKRLLGRLYAEIAADEELYPFKLAEEKDGRVLIEVGGRGYLPEELSARVLKKLKDAAESYLGESVQRAVVTVPAYFDDLQRQATLEAAKLAGLEVLRLLNEPTAAAMAYGLGRDGQHTVAVYDFGGGTFDFSVLEIDNKTFEVLLSTGDSRLGGDDLDKLLVDHLADIFYQAHGIDLRQDLLTLRRLMDAAEKAKCELSSAYETLVNLPFITYKDGQALHLECSLARETFEALAEPLIRETIDCCGHALRQAKVKKNEITRIILVGGSTRIPLVQDMVEEFFGIAPFKGLNPDEIVAVGAATQGAVMNGELDDVVLLDVTPHCLGLEIKGNRKSTVIEQNSTIPIKVTKTFTTTEENQSYVNIHALQGDSEQASECRSLGKFTLSGIANAPAGIPRIQVTFFINADGIVDISANDVQSGAAKSLTINHASLTVDERRSQQIGEPRRKRRRRQNTAIEGRLASRGGPTAAADSGQPVPSVPGEGPMAAAESLVAAQAIPDRAPDGAGESRSRERLSGTFAEINGDTQPRDETTPERRVSTQKQSLDRTRTQVGKSRSAPPRAASRNAAPPPRPVTNPAWRREAPAPASGAPRAARAPSAQPVVDASAELGTPSAALGLQCAVPPRLEPVVEQLVRGRQDAQACQAYTSAREEFLRFCRQNTCEVSLQLLLARFFLYTRQAEEARDVLEAVRAQSADPVTEREVIEIYGQLCRLFPHYIAARKERAALALAAGDVSTAMLDLEFVIKREEGDEEALGRLAQVYEKVLAEKPDHTVQFKLVKLHLRRQELDAAIGLLQQLVSLPDYRDRANRVLGLCFWQKGMRYLAWQKFRNLALDEELKDILYRLSEDMEQHDELLHAKYALERIYENDISFREVGERMKKLTYRMQLQKDDRYGAGHVRTPLPAEAGSEFSRRFEVIEEINRGSMGIVFKARDLIVDEIVAIKILNDFLCSDPAAVERFKQEARSARKLTHLNIVRIHDMFELDDKKIISMEYIEGENLKTLLARSVTFTEDSVLNYLVQICEGLAYAHRLHVVHRDIKPANIMLTDRGVVKITDFGIAKLLTDQQTKGGTMVMGTPLYMAPEQIEGSKVDHRCDVYSLGIMLYELVSGQPPFHEGNIEYQHIHHPAPEIRIGISERLREVIMRCVEKDPAKRFQNVEEILARII